MRRFGLSIAAFMALAHSAAAQGFDVVFPGRATLMAENSAALASHSLPTGPFQNGVLAVENFDAPIARSAFRIEGGEALTTAVILSAVKPQLAEAGFDVVYECSAAQCGGFDFRFALDLLPEPEMHVDIGDFRYVLARRAGGDVLAVVISRSPSYGFVHLTRLGDFATQAPKLTEATKSPLIFTPKVTLPAAAQTQTAPDFATLLANGAEVVLDGVVFDPSKASLKGAESESVAALAAWLQSTPAAAIILTGHTDTSGNPQANLTLSSARAQSLRDWLVAQYGIDPARIDTIGRGDTAPIASNDTGEGRAQNRRVTVALRP